MHLAGLGEVAGGAGVAGVGGVGHVAGECRKTARPAAAQPTRSAPAYTFSASPRAKPPSVIPCSRASAIASEDGAPTPTRIGQPATAAFWTSSNESRPLTQRIRPRERDEAVEQRPPDHLVHRVVPPDVLARGEQVARAASKSPVACSPPVRAKPGCAASSRSGSAASSSRGTHAAPARRGGACTATSSQRAPAADAARG